MGQEALVSPALASGRLVAPFREVLLRPRAMVLRSARPLPKARQAALRSSSPVVRPPREAENTPHLNDR